MVRRSRPLSALWLLGRLRVVRGYWTCGCAKGGRCPLDEELGVKGRDGTRATPGLARAVAPLAAETAFAPAAALASRLLGFVVNAKWMERMVKRLGSEMAAADATRRCTGHVEANRARMNYPAFRAAGLPVGFGGRGERGAVAGRLKRGGMRWSVESGANPMLALRCRWLDGRHDEFFKARARPPPVALAA